MPHGGIKDVTEECFQQNPLEFEGDDQWVVYRLQEDNFKHQFDFQGRCPFWTSHSGVRKQDDRRHFSKRLNVDDEPPLPIVIIIRLYQTNSNISPQSSCHLLMLSSYQGGDWSSWSWARTGWSHWLCQSSRKFGARVGICWFMQLTPQWNMMLHF